MTVMTNMIEIIIVVITLHVNSAGLGMLKQLLNIISVCSYP